MTMLLQLVYDTVQKYGKGKCDTGFNWFCLVAATKPEKKLQSHKNLLLLTAYWYGVNCISDSDHKVRMCNSELSC